MKNNAKESKNMKDLTHYFHSPPQHERATSENQESDMVSKKKETKKSKKSKKKKNKSEHLSLNESDHYDSPLSERRCSSISFDQLENKTKVDSASANNENNISCNGVSEQEVVNSSRVKTDDLDEYKNSSSKKNKRKRNTSVVCDDEPEKKMKRKIEKGRLKIIKVDSDSPSLNEDSLGSCENVNITKVNKAIVISSLIKQKLSILQSEDSEDCSYLESEKAIPGKRWSKRSAKKLKFCNEQNDDLLAQNENANEKVKKERKKRTKKKESKDSLSDLDLTPPDSQKYKDDGKSSELKNGTDKSLDLMDNGNEKRNSLFNYYMKVDKASIEEIKRNEKIKVEVLIHTPPSEKKLFVKNPSAESKKSLKTKTDRLRRELLKSSDEIKVLSSEEILSPPVVELDNETKENSPNNIKANYRSPPLSSISSKSETPGSGWKMRVILSSSKAAPTEEDLLDSDDSVSEINMMASAKKNLSGLMRLKLSDKPKKIEKKLRKLDFAMDSEDSAIEMKRRTMDNKVSNKILKSANKQKRSKKKTASPDSVISLDESSSDSVREIVSAKKDSVNSRVIDGQAKVSTSGKSAAGIMAKFLGITSTAPTGKESSPKREIDPSVLIARQKFLQSGIPDEVRQKCNIQSEKVLGKPAGFPKISHVQQRDRMRLIWNIPDPHLKFFPPPTADFDIPPKWVSINTHPPPQPNLDTADEPLIPIQNPKRIIRELRKSESGLAVNERWSALKEQKSAAGESDSWADVYKPKSSRDILGNTSNVERLKTWLETFKTSSAKQTSDSSGEEFVSSDEESGLPVQERTCIISGPHGCGKTSAVYAIADELGYKVLEVNASCNRNGKKVFTNLSEATQSHQVEHSQSLKSLLRPAKKIKKKKKHAKEDVSSKKRSLILVEDADMLFEGVDDGFVAAISTLTATSKRPMVFIVNNSKASHLVKLVQPKDLKLQFIRPQVSKLAIWLQLVALSEGMQLNTRSAEDIAHWSECDIRRSLLQLQFLVQSHQNSVKGWLKLCDPISCPTTVEPVDAVLNNLDEVEENGRRNLDRAATLKKLGSVARFADSLILNDLLTTSTFSKGKLKDPCPRPQSSNPEDSTSLLEPSNAISENVLSSELADFMLQSVNSYSSSDICCLFQVWKTNQTLMSALPYAVHCSHDSVFSDYLPVLRTFGRSEQIRLATHTKRGSRFYNYLQGLGVDTSGTNIRVMCDAFS